MYLPKAVQDAVKNSESLQKQLNEGEPKDQDRTTPPPESGPLDKSADTQPQDAVEKQTDTPPQAPDDWEQRYKTLQGKYNAQVPRLQQDIRRLQESLSALENEKAQLQKAAETKPDDFQGQSTLDKEAFAEYGEDFGTLVDTIQKLEQRNAALSDEVQRLSGDVTQDRQAKAQEAYDRYLRDVTDRVAALGGNLTQLDSSPQFLNWLRQYPEGEAESRHAKLQRAESVKDVSATVEIFQEYLGGTAPPAAPASTPPNMQPPSGPPAHPPTARPEGKMWTRTEISKFYADKVKGVYEGRDEEAAQIEADIHAAPGEGRVSS
jgi:DNA repair exonuclease SbcCD ATPase subunit